MASYLVRSPPPPPLPSNPPPQQPHSIPPHLSSCPFTRNQESRVYYESEYSFLSNLNNSGYSEGTSWEFCGIEADVSMSNSLYNHTYCHNCDYDYGHLGTNRSSHTPMLSANQSHSQLQLSVLRGPQMSSSICLETSNPRSVLAVMDHSHPLHRSIPSPPMPPPPKDDLSDGSRNSTGSSSSRSHRSQDSGFSDSGEIRLRKLQNLNQSQKHNSQSSKLYVGCQPQYEPHCITPIPSPIPHNSNDGNNGTYTISRPRQFYEDSQHRHTHSNLLYGEINGNINTNSIYSELPLVNMNQHSSSSSRSNSNINQSQSHSHSYSSPYYHHPQIQTQEHHFGTPICSSTPKRSNINSNSTSKVTIMQKIDNFESLNKNKRSSLDNNNNSNNTPSSSSQTSCLSSSKKNSSKSKSKLSLCQTPTNECVEKTTVQQNQSKSKSPRAPLPLPSDNSVSSSLTNTNQPKELKSCLKPPSTKNLPKGFKRVSTKELSASFIEEGGSSISASRFEADVDGELVIVKSHFDNDAMRLWLHELRSQTESECCYLLQSKSISAINEEMENRQNMAKVCAEEDKSDSDSGTYGSQESRRSEKNQKPSEIVQAIHQISNPLMSIKNVEQMANIVSAEFAKICKNIEFGFLPQVPSLVMKLVKYVEQFLHAFQSTNTTKNINKGKGSFPATPTVNLQKLENKLARSCRRLQRAAKIMMEISPSTEQTQARSVYSIIEGSDGSKSRHQEGYPLAVSDVVDGIVSVGNLFSQVVDLRLTRDLSLILDTVEGGGVPGKVALKELVNVLLDGGNHLCRLASEIRTVRGLLGVILDARDDYFRILSLRCLATVLCVGEAVKDFDRASGFEIVADFMYEPLYPFDLKIEAVSVLTQATDPWIDLETSLSTLGSNLEKIIVALTNLIPYCNSEEPFLLLVAAISNLTFLEVSSIHILKKYGTISLIIQEVEKTQQNFSVFVLDHVATILANMAGVDSCRDCIIKCGGVQALLKFLQTRPQNSAPASEIMACERVQQKSTIAISRLCTEEGVAHLILERGGVHRLVQLSRNEKERNYSDGVLIAALATLRKLVNICGDEEIHNLKADDLIKPRLLDSFLLYSSRQESYV